MGEKYQKTITFIMPGETTLDEVIDQILNENDLQESPAEYFDIVVKGGEPRSKVAIQAAETLAEKKVSEEKLVELLEKHLKTSTEIAQKIVQGIKEKVIPFAQKFGEKKDLPVSTENFQEELLRKIKAGRNVPVQKEKEEPLPAYPKEVPITDVDKNAEQMNKEGKNVITNERNKFTQNKPVNPQPPQPPPTKEDDKYKEPIG